MRLQSTPGFAGRGDGRAQGSKRVLHGRTPVWVFALSLGGAALVDQITKAVAVASLVSGPAHLGVVHLRLVANRGLLMGMLQAPTVFVILVTVAAVGSTWWVARRSSLVGTVAFGLIAGGAVGNLVDRFVERQMFPPYAVVDWLSFGGMTFNLADVALLIGTMILLSDQGEVDAASPADARL